MRHLAVTCPCLEYCKAHAPAIGERERFEARREPRAEHVEWHMHCSRPGMDQTLSRLLTASALALSAGVFSSVACTHTADRVVEPPGGADASTTSPEVADGSAAPIGPIAPLEPMGAEQKEDFRLVRAPEFGAIRAEAMFLEPSAARQASGLGGASGNAGFGGSDSRPVVASGGSHYY